MAERTVSRRVEITFDAADDETADWFADFLRRVLMGEQWGTFADAARFDRFPIINPAWSVEPVRAERRWVEDGGPSGMGAPEGWHVTWCPRCCYAATYTDAELADFDAHDYGMPWFAVVAEAYAHDCPGR